MEENKEFSPEVKKAIKIYTIELIILSVVFLVLGFLVIFNIITISKTAQRIVPWVGAIGGFILVGDLIWLIASKKRQAKTSLFDKLLTSPLGLAVSGIDIYILVMGYTEDNVAVVGQSFFQYFIGSLLIYIALAYCAMAIYHIKRPVPSLLLLDEEEEKAKTEKLNDINSIIQEENKEEKVEETITEEEKKD